MKERDEFEAKPAALDVYGQAAGFYVVLSKNGYFQEAAEFAEWFLDTFDFDLET